METCGGLAQLARLDVSRNRVGRARALDVAAALAGPCRFPVQLRL